MDTILELAPLMPPNPEDGGETSDRKARRMRKRMPLAARMTALSRAGFNVALLSASELSLDLESEEGLQSCPPARISPLFGMRHAVELPRGRSAERLVCETLARPGTLVITNCGFSTTRTNLAAQGAGLLELPRPAAYRTESGEPFKGDLDLERFEALLKGEVSSIGFLRMESAAKLLGGQPFSLGNLRTLSTLARSRGIPLVLDATRIEENLALIREREEGMAARSSSSLLEEIGSLCDLVYLSGCRPPRARSGAILCSEVGLFERIRAGLPGTAAAIAASRPASDPLASASSRLRRSAELTVRLAAAGLPMSLPSGALGCHVDARRFLPLVTPRAFPAASLAAAFYLATGLRAAECGSLSARPEGHAEAGEEALELLRLGLPAEGLSCAAQRFIEDRLAWLLANASLVGGLRLVEEPPSLRYLTGRLEPLGDWPRRLGAALTEDYGAGA